MRGIRMKQSNLCKGSLCFGQPASRLPSRSCSGGLTYCCRNHCLASCTSELGSQHIQML